MCPRRTDEEMGSGTRECPCSQPRVSPSVGRDLCDSRTCASRGLASSARVGLCPVGWGFPCREGGSGGYEAGTGDRSPSEFLALWDGDGGLNWRH